MTRIYGFIKDRNSKEQSQPLVDEVLDKLQNALKITYQKGWQAAGLGFILIDELGANKYSVYKGYKGILEADNIRTVIPEKLHLKLKKPLMGLIAVLQNFPDTGEQKFNAIPKGKFPLECEDWFAITMGTWSTEIFNDVTLPWYSKTRPSESIINYLATNPNHVDFSWIDERREPQVFAVKKTGQLYY